ncbi:hypothetical protein CGCF413_v002125 [Colletotrichum fructicola]|nr:hypothetical protein CGCF413_v002125 [Colletotrichum fructicola]
MRQRTSMSVSRNLNMHTGSESRVLPHNIMLDLPSLGVSANERRSQKASRTIAKSDDSGSWQSSQCPQLPPTSGELAITERRVHSAATLDLDEVPLFWQR